MWSSNIYFHYSNNPEQSVPEGSVQSSSEKSDNEPTNIPKSSGYTHNTSQSSDNFSNQKSNDSNNNNYVDDPQRNSSEMDIAGSTRKSAFAQLILAILFGVVAIAAGWQFRATHGTLNTNNRYEKLMFYKDLNELGNKYRISDDSILQIKSGKYS